MRRAAIGVLTLRAALVVAPARVARSRPGPAGAARKTSAAAGVSAALTAAILAAER